MRRKALAAVLAATTFFGLAACGGGGGDTTSGSAKIEGRGPITLVQGKDTSGFVQGVLDKWNKQHPDEKARLIELPEDADSQREKMLQNAQTKSDAYDVLVTDVVWTSEFAANRVIIPLPEKEFQLDKMLKPVVDTTKYQGKLYAAPSSSDGGLLYYRTDLMKAAGISDPPQTWQELIDDCKKIQATPQGKGVNCYAGQFEKYEGLTVNASEVINGAGGVVTDDSGKPDVNTPEAAKGLDFLVNGFKQGYIPKEAITYKEEEGRRAFQGGKLIFHRQWPYQYNLANGDEGTKVKGKFAVAPLPGLDGPGASSLGGHNLAISTYSKNKASALDFIKFYTSEQNQKTNLELASQAPTFADLYDDASLQEKYPYLTTLRDSINGAVPRPKVVQYGDATTAIQDAAYAALTGDKSTTDALKDLQSQLESITSGQGQ
ncbi:MAG: ABC transporter substrate-binding protein [Nocardioidaceae bacterium]|nr:ABC transporter substrate-binding protein [Nocardioidaceae bacterium]NUS53011.1 ABC transporter substrate-binding protein [Nocardioidaceae bacterium]